MQYPGRTIKSGEKNPGVVKALKQQLNQALVLSSRTPMKKLDENNPKFGPTTAEAVRMFQSQRVDRRGVPLKVDGEVGALTWEALFGKQSVPTATIKAADAFLGNVVRLARGEIGVMEQPKNSNNGPRVRQYLESVGLGPGYAWCVAFTYFCFKTAAAAEGRTNPMYRTAGVLDHWAQCVPKKGASRLTAAKAVADPGLVLPGMLFIMDHGGGHGHTGFVERVAGGVIHTIEGNTDASKTREGGGVYALQRKIVDINKGFIDYAGL